MKKQKCMRRPQTISTPPLKQQQQTTTPIAPVLEERGEKRRSQYLLPDDGFVGGRSWSCPDLSTGYIPLPGSPLKHSLSENDFFELARVGERVQEKKIVPSRRHSAEMHSANIENLIKEGECKRWSVGSTYERVTKRLPPEREETTTTPKSESKFSEEAHNEGIKSAPIPSSVKPKSILRKSGSDQPLAQPPHRLDAPPEKVFSNKLIVTAIEWGESDNEKAGSVVKHEVDSPTLEKQSPATPLAEIARLHLDEPSVYFDAHEEDSDDPRRNGDGEDEFDTPPKDDPQHSTNISSDIDRKRSPTPPNHRSSAAAKYGCARRKLKDVADFEAVIEEDKEGGSASDCQSPRRVRQDSVTQTRPVAEPHFPRSAASGNGADDFVRSTIPVHMMDTCREPTPETDSDSWRVAKTASEECVRPPYMLKPYNSRRRPRSMIEGGGSKLGSPSNGKYTPDFSSSSSKSYRPESKTPRQTGGPFYPARVYRVEPGHHQADPASRSASSSREESDYMDTATTNNGVRMPPPPQKRSDLFTRSISWDAKFRSKDRSPNNSNSSGRNKASNPNPGGEDGRYSSDWRGGRHSRRRHRGAGGMLSSESRIPRPKLRPRLADSAEEPMDFQTTTGPQGVSSSLPALQQQVPEVHRNCKSEVLIPRFKQEGGPVYMQPR